MVEFEKVQFENEGQLLNKMKVLQQRLNALLLQHNDCKCLHKLILFDSEENPGKGLAPK